MTTDETLPTVFRLQGEVDLARQAELDAIAAAAAESQVAIVDMTEVTFIDSTVLNWLVHVKQALEQRNGRLRVVALDGVVTRLLSIAGLGEVIEVFPNQLQASG